MRNVKESFGNTDDEFTSKLSNNFNLANSAHATDLDEIVIKRQMHQGIIYLSTYILIRTSLFAALGFH